MKKRIKLLAMLMGVTTLMCGCEGITHKDVFVKTEKTVETKEPVSDGKIHETENAGADEDIAENGKNHEPESFEATESFEGTEICEETETIPEPEVKTVTITAVGDCTLGKNWNHGYSGSFYDYYDRNGQDYFFDGVRDYFENDDFTIINLECVLSNSEARVDKQYTLKGKPEYVGIMSGSSVEGCSLGNNHSSDYGWDSLVETQQVLDKADIQYGFDEHIGKYTTEDGLTIGFVSTSLLSCSQDRVNILKDGISKLKEENTDVIIACCHWGIEREYYPNKFQRDTAHELIDSGADLVIGNHPHVLQGVELYSGKVICYSLGNFCFGGNRNPTDKDTMMFQQTFSFIDGEKSEEVDAKIIPCTLSSNAGYNDFQPTVVEGDKWKSIISNVNKYSKPYSNIRFDDSGVAIKRE